MGKVMLNIVGNKYGHLLVLNDRYARTTKGKLLCLCKCDCGTTIAVDRNRLISNTKLDCGCNMSKPQKELTEYDVKMQAMKEAEKSIAQYLKSIRGQI